jgi:uncharacterized repeat protein (TIGR04076 family)
MSEVKITVLRKLYHRELYEQYGVNAGEPCKAFEIGQEFVVPKHVAVPEGFCGWAWSDIMKYVLTLARGGSFVGSKPGTFVASCSDGYSPVIFKIERV